MKRKGYKRSGFSVFGALMFFALIAFVMQIAILVYDYIIQRTNDNVAIALLILNVIFILSAICTLIDILRRKIMIDRPVQKILSATERIASGNFDTEIEISHIYGNYDAYDLIAENINKMAKELHKSEILKTDFVSNVSHEIKTPLAIMKGYASELLQTEDPETKQKYAEGILSASERLSKLVTNILELSRLENQTIKPQYEKIDLTAQLSDCVLAFEDAAERKNIELFCDFDDVRITSLPVHLEMIWNNLMSNAVKFTERGGKISISLKSSGEKTVVSFTDSGCGISAESGKRIFEKFYQADESHSAEGNGLGLALVKKIIDILGAEISVDSKLGVGTTFTVVLRNGEEQR